jgi:hypothetical protein
MTRSGKNFHMDGLHTGARPSFLKLHFLSQYIRTPFAVSSPYTFPTVVVLLGFDTLPLRRIFTAVFLCVIK